MSEHDVKDMEELHDPVFKNEETEEKFSDDGRDEAEDEIVVEEISDQLRQVDLTEIGEVPPPPQQAAVEKTGAKTIEQWLTRDNLVVYPVWIGNLPRETSVPDLRGFLETEIGRVLISVHISPKRNTNERTYAFLNLPTAEKQILAVTLLDGTVFHGEKLIVRSKRPSKFPQSFFGSSPISDHFKHFRDCVVPAILAAPTVNLNVHAVKRIMEEHNVGLDHLPNRVWCVQCTLTPNCHRTYCSFYHNQEERELGRIISILAAQNCNDTGLRSGETPSGFDMSANDNGDIVKRPVAVSRHTLLIEGLPKSVSTQKLTEMFEVFGEIDHVIVNPNNTCFLRMKRSQDAKKIVHLLNMNNSGIQIQFAPYAANPVLMTALRTASLAKRNRSNEHGASGDSHIRSYNRSSGRGRGGPSLEQQMNTWSHDTADTDVTMPSLINQGFTQSASAGGPVSYGGDSSSHQGRSSRGTNGYGHSTTRGGYGQNSGMPHALPAPSPSFKDDDMQIPLQRPQQHRYPVSASPYDYDERLMTPTTDYRGYGMVMGYGTPTTTSGADWGSAGMYAGYPSGYPAQYYQYPHQNAGLPQLSHMSASDPIGYHHTHHHSGYGGYGHGSYAQREQPSRHRHGGSNSRRHNHHSQTHSGHGYNHNSHSGHGYGMTTHRSGHVEREAGEVIVPAQSKPPTGRSSLSGPQINDVLDGIPGL